MSDNKQSEKKNVQELNKMLKKDKEEQSGIPIDNDEMKANPEDTEAKDQTKSPNEDEYIKPYNKKIYEPDPKKNK